MSSRCVACVLLRSVGRTLKEAASQLFVNGGVPIDELDQVVEVSMLTGIAAFSAIEGDLESGFCIQHHAMFVDLRDKVREADGIGREQARGKLDA